MEMPHRPRSIYKEITVIFLKARGTTRESVRFRGAGLQHVDGLAQDCSISSAFVMEILQSCIKSSMCWSSLCLQICGSGLLLILRHGQVTSLTD